YLKEFNINTLYYLDFNENSEEVNTDVSVKKIVVKEINHVLELPFWEQFLEKES
ncbi:15443_t:CDS:1, partial [Acaulospora morrowiae]